MKKSIRFCMVSMLASILLAGSASFAQDKVIVVSVLDYYEGLEGLGEGTITIEQLLPPGPTMTGNPVFMSVPSNAVLQITANPTPVAGGRDSFVYKWLGDVPESYEDRKPAHPVTMLVSMKGEDKEIELLLSHEYHSGEGWGDLDLDGLPDVWEVKYGLDPEDATGDNGDTGNPTGDKMPGGWVPDGMNVFLSGNYPAVLAGLNTDWPYRFPTTGVRPPQYYIGVIPFNNWFQARGFDGWYGLNTLTGINDDPGTDPKLLSTAGDGISDGWKYYFYGTLKNIPTPPFEGVALDLASFDPNVNWDIPVLPIPANDMLAIFGTKLQVDPSGDLDADCASILDEFLAGTDPFHWDTDADEISDGYEIRKELNPINPADGNDNPSGDYMAYTDDGAGVERRHRQVYDDLGFDPRTGWGAFYLSRGSSRELTVQENTISFTSREKFLASLYLGFLQGALDCANFDDFALDPKKIDTDDDGIFDGWELYVGLNPKIKPDPMPDGDNDGLDDFMEFSAYDINLTRGATWPNGRTHFDSAWLNKFWPTDPNNPDTDGDSLTDGAEGGYKDVDVVEGEDVSGGLAVLKYAGGTVKWNGSCYAGGGLNPTSVDTDGDGIPDHWEAITAHRSRIYDLEDLNLRNGMDGTVKDAARDYDGDGLVNYQEYLSGAVHHWRYTEWAPGHPLGGYDPFTYFTGTPFAWDWHLKVNSVPFFYIPPVNNRYTATNPRLSDTDLDDMDDYWEIYHGLNPMFGVLDVHNSMILGATVLAGMPPTFDIRVAPYAAGSPFADPDQDGLPNWEESLQANAPPPKYYHTDPSPSWITDPSYQRSFVNLYYDLGTLALLAPGWYYGPSGWTPPSYLFSFENSEGFDTDGDMLGDRAELVHSQASPGSTDPLSPESPPRRRALYLNGDAAARTRGSFLHGLNDLTEFTVEAWVKPVNPASGMLQVVIERPVWIPDGNVMSFPEGIRRNFRLAIDADGRPLASYTGAGFDGLEYQDVIAKSIHPLEAGRWQHLSGVYDGTQKKLFLYVNGEMRASIPSAERPVNGWSTPDPLYLDVNPGFTFDAPLVVGAADRNPVGRVNGQPVWVGSQAGTIFTAPDLHSFLEGWVDEVRIWNGAKTMAEVQRDMSRKLRLADVATYQRPLLSTNATPELKYLYSFDNLLDPTSEGIVPAGFDLLNGRPNDGSYPNVPWWGTAADRSLVYNNYLFVPWIVNLAARLPLDPPADSPFNTSTYEVGTATLTRTFPNTANPYNLGYYHASFYRMERHPDAYPLVRAFNPANQSPLFNDLLPLRFARVDSTVELWDGAGSGGEEYDSNGDGIPDSWCQEYGFDPFDNSVAGMDPNGNGINNYWSYMLGADPFNEFSLDPAGIISDADWDSDGDDLSNYDELNIYFTDPTRMDTDDDEINDGDEVRGVDNRESDPRRSYSPMIFRALRFGDGGGIGQVVVSDKIGLEDTERHSLTNWTIEALVRPAVYPAVSNALISRRVQATGRINYELGLTTNGMPYVRFQSGAGGVMKELVGLTPLAISEWTHVAARFDLATGVLSLFVDGKRNNYGPATLVPAQGPGDLVFGGNGYVGDLKEIRVWSIPRTDAEIAAFKARNLFLGHGALDPAVLRTFGGNEHLRQNCVTADPVTGITIDSLDTWTLETWVKTTSKSAGTIIARWNTGTDLGGEDFNYYLGMRPDGTLIGRWVLAYTKEEEKEGGEDGEIDESEVILNPTVNNIVGAMPINDGEWHHVAYVRDANKAALYVDGIIDAVQDPTLVPLGEKIVNWGVRSLAGPLSIGHQLEADFDEVRVWNRGLSRGELNLYNKQSLYGNEPGLITYFNFDFQRSDLAEDRAVVKDNVEEPGVYISPAMLMKTGDYPPVLTDPIQTYRLALAGYYPADDGGFTLEDYQNPLDWDYAGQLINDVQFVELDPAEYPFQEDNNYDGIPNWWDILNGMDPDGNSSPGDEDGYIYDPSDFTFGAWGDPDHDGLNNWAEWQAGTDPNRFDSDGDGRSDYDSPATGASFGTLYTDTDMMPDAWESLFPRACSPRLYDPHLDPDRDGWDNLSEYLGTGVDYSYQAVSNWIASNNTWDVQWVITERTTVSPTRPDDGKSFPLPELNLTFYGEALNYVAATEFETSNEGYLVPDDVALIVWAFSDLEMRAPDAQTLIPVQSVFENGVMATVTEWAIGHVHQGPNIFMAFIDMNADGKWNAGEWLGFSESGIDDIQLGAAEIKIPLTDKPAGYIRFSWEQQMDAIQAAVAHVGGTTYRVAIKALSEAGKPIIYSATRNLEALGRPNIMEMDLKLAGIEPMYGAYEWTVGSADGVVYAIGTNSITYPSSLAKPVLQSPAGTMLFAQERLRLKLDPRATQVQIQIQNISNGQTVLNVTKPAPHVDNKGIAEMDLPILAGFGSFTNGQYRIQVRAYNPRASATSDWVNFALSLKPPTQGGAAMITGRIYYYGWESNATIIVEAYSGRGTLAKVLAVPQSGYWKYDLMGVKIGDFHVRAFHDRNNNGVLDQGENWGLVKGSRDDRTVDTPTIYTVDYAVKRIEIRNPAVYSGNDLVIYDADTDNDGIVDSYEYRFAGNLTAMNGQSNVTGDDWRDIDNFALGRDPTQTYPAPLAIPKLTVGPLVKSGSQLLLTYEVSGLMPRVVVVQSATNLAPSGWKEEFRSEVRKSGVYTKEVTPETTSGTKFFRIRYVE